MADLIKIRRDTKAHWDAVSGSVILQEGEIGIITDAAPKQCKIGNGYDVWGALPYQSWVNPDKLEDYDRKDLGYVVCSTGGGQVAKVVNDPTILVNYELGENVRLLVKMNQANTASGSITLAVNGTDAKPLQYNGAAASNTNTWANNEVLDVYYDGVSYVANTHGGAQFATGEKVSDVSIESSPVSGSTNLVTSDGIFEAVTNLSSSLNEQIDSVSSSLSSSIDNVSFNTGQKVKEVGIGNVPGTSQTTLMTQRGATDLISEYNVSANNSNAEYTFAQAVALVPSSLQKGGLTIKYIDSTTHEYAIKRLMSSTWNTTESNWQGIDDEPTAGSDNLVTSGGVYEEIEGKIDKEELINMSIISVDELEYYSSAINLLLNDGTLSNHPDLHHYKYLIPNGVTKLYLSGTFQLSTGNGYSMFWLVSNNTMTSFESITSYPQVVDNKEIEVGNATEIWINPGLETVLTYYKKNTVTPEELTEATNKSYVLYEPQVLSDEEKEQARENIGSMGTKDAYPNLLNITDTDGYLLCYFDENGKVVTKNDRLYALMNKKAVCFGDSITKGSWLNFIKYSGSGSEDMSYIISHRWTQRLKEYFGWEMGTPNQVTGVGGGFQGYSGYPLSNARPINSSCIIYKIEEYFSEVANISTPPDIVILWGGHNDVGYYAGDVLQAASPLGDFNDGPTLSDRLIETNAKVGTFCGALRYATELVEHFAPNAQMYVLTPLLTQNNTWNTQMKDESDGVHYIKDMAYSIVSGADIFGYTFVQMGGCGIDSQNGVAGFFTADGLHPNIAGTDLIVNYLKNILKSK